MQPSLRFPVTLLAVALLAASPAHATLLAYEAFEIGAPVGYALGALPTQNPTGTPYSTAAWAATDVRMAGSDGAGGTFPSNRGVVATGLNQGLAPGDYLTSGGSFRPNTFLNTIGNLGGAHSATRALAASATSTGLSDGEFIWFSGFIQAPETALPSGSSLMMGYSGTATGSRGMLVGFNGDQIAVTGRGFNATAGSTAFATTDLQAYNLGQTYFFVARLGLNDGAAGVGGNGTSNDLFEMWLDPANPTSLANLGAANVALPTFAFGGPSEINILRAYSVTAGGENLDSTLLRTAGFDEYRLGTTLESVLPAVIPEPGTLVLVGVSLAALVFIRRRK